MPEVLEECQKRIKEYENQVSAISEYQDLVSKFEKALYGSTEKQLIIPQVSDVLKLFFYLGIPQEKWFLITEIMQDLSQDIDCDWRGEEWFVILQTLMKIDQQSLNNYLEALNHYLKKNDYDQIVATEVNSIIEKYATDQMSCYTVEEEIALAVVVKHNFNNIFENEQNFRNNETTVDGVKKTFSFLLLLTMAYSKLHEEKVYFDALLGSLLLYRQDLLMLNQKIRHKELEMRKAKEESTRIVFIRKTTPQNLRLIEKYKEYMEILLKIEPIDDLITMSHDNQSKLEKDQRELRQQMGHLRKIITEYIKQKEFYHIHPSVLELIDLSLQKQILWEIRNHNKNRLMELKEQMKQCQKSNFDKIAHILNSYGCSTNHLTEQERTTLVSRYSEEEIKVMIDAIDKIPMEWKSRYYFLLTKSDLTRIQKIDYYMKKKYLTESFLKTHMDYFEITSPSFQNFEEILKAIEEVGIDPKDITKKNETIWEEECSKIKERIALHRKYGTNFQNNPQHWYDYLQSDIAFDLFDEWIELGFLGYTRHHPYLLKEQNKLVGKKIRLMQEMGFQEENGRIRSSCFTEQYLNEEDIEAYFEGEYIPVEDSILEKESRLQISSKTMTLPIVRELDTKYLVSDSLYQINDVFVSRNRFLRNLEVLKDHPEISFSQQVKRSLIYTPYKGYTEEMIQRLQQIVPSVKQKRID